VLLKLQQRDKLQDAPLSSPRFHARREMLMDEADPARRFMTLQPRSKARIRHLVANSEHRGSGDGNGKLRLERETACARRRTLSRTNERIFHSTFGIWLFSITLFKYHALFSNVMRERSPGARPGHGFTLLTYRVSLRRLLCSGFTLACQQRRST
jgi:hypothetical protein